MSQTLYSKRMGKEIARLDREEKMRVNKEIAGADPQSCNIQEEDEQMHGELQIFVKICGGLWG